MNDQIASRIDSLRHEFEAGEAQLRDLDAQRARLHETMLRISGAIQVLEELQVEQGSSNGAAAESVEASA